MASSVQPSPGRPTAPQLKAVQPRDDPRTSLLVIASFLAVYLIWGSTYFAIRVGLESFPPLLLAGTRHVGAGALLYLLFRRGGTRPTKAQWMTAAITGVLLLFGGNGGVCWAEQSGPAGVTALL